MTPTTTLDLARELTEAMILDEAMCVGSGADNLDAFRKIRDWGALLDRIHMARGLAHELESGDLERVAEIAMWWADQPAELESPERVALTTKAQTFLCEHYEAA